MANIKVAVRVRPISEREINFTGSEIVVHTEAKAISLTNLKVSSSKAGDSRERTRRYGFDYCFDSSDPSGDKYASQSRIYETLGESILDVLFRGYNSCLVAYGQSASGKTYTMMGSKEEPGLTPRVCEGLFLRLADEEKNNKNLDVSVSYLEVYNERVRDLLKPSSNSIGLKVREHPRLGPYVQGLTHHAVPSLGSLISRVEEGTRARKTASTLQNPTSSRSHALLTLSLLPSTSNLGQSSTSTTTAPINVVTRKNDNFPRGSKLHLVDLAGSESAAACGGVNRLKEGANINKSLVALGNVISALAERGSTGSGPGRRFIPYRDSALTWLLKDALGGNATTIMLATISPASGSYNETSHTLRFAQRAQSVVNRPVINEDPVSRIIRELRAEVARLKSLLVEKNIDPDCKSICLCQPGQEIKSQGHETQEIDRGGLEEDKVLDEKEYKVSTGASHSGIPERRHSTSESLLTRNKFSPTLRRFGSVDIAREVKTVSSDALIVDNYNLARESELIINDEVDEPVFVDIPTLVAVLIKPDDNIKTSEHQIEEIVSHDVHEDSTDAELSANIDPRVSASSDESPNFQTKKAPSDVNVGFLEATENPKSPLKASSSSSSSSSSRESTIGGGEKVKLRKQDSIDGDSSSRPSSNLQSLKKYGSIEILPKKREIACSLQRSQTNLEKRNGSQDKLKKLNNIKEIEDPRSSKTSVSWRNLGGWTFPRKGSNDSDKSLKESSIGRAKNQGRKQSIDGLKRKTSKDSSSSGSKDELLSAGSQVRDKSSRKGSLENEPIVTRVHTPIQRARRADIVAAVTERLYSSKKLVEDNNGAATGTSATSTPASGIRSPENTDVKFASTTRMRLQEISRKMLAKRRRICVETQTDNQQTLRMRDVGSITEETKVMSKDASILTDRHEDYEILPFVDCPVTRVKEMSTLTDTELREPVIRCKDAGNVTDDCDDDYAGNSSRNDSGIMSDDTQNYAESNLSSTAMSDLCPIGDRRSVELVENSTNTRLPTGLPNSSSQTRSEDLAMMGCSNCEVRCCGGMRHCHRSVELENVDNNQISHHADRNVISISLPDMVSITIETSNGMESKIKVFEGNENDERAHVSLKDNAAQTDSKDSLEIATSTDDIFGQLCFNDISTTSKPMMTQTDGKTFRIENIFHEPRGVTRIPPRIEIVGDSSDDSAASNSLIVTNSIGTSFVPEMRENATGMERSRHYGSRMFLGSTPKRRSLSNDGFVKNSWSSRWRSCSPNSRWQNSYSGYPVLTDTHRSLSDISMDNWRDRGMSNFSNEAHSPIGSDGKVLGHVGPMKDTVNRTIHNEDFTKTNKLDDSVIGIRSSCVNVMLSSGKCVEQDPNFSDDSLDSLEDCVTIDRDVVKPLMESNDRINAAVITVNEKACPPDLVVHTKKIKDSSILVDGRSLFEDFDDENQLIEFPKMKLDSAASSTHIAPISDFKMIIMGDPCYTMNHAEDSDLTDFESQTSTLLMDNEDYGRYSRVDVVEDMEQWLVNGGNSVAPKSIIKRTPRISMNSRLSECPSNDDSTNLDAEKTSRKKVRFAIPEMIETSTASSDSEISDNATRNDDIIGRGPRTILEEYLDEAVVFMRNMNSMNEYMSAACGSDKRATNSRNGRRVKAKRKNYIEYEGRRISLEDDTDNCAKSDDDDLDFNVESYDKVLRSMDRLEDCLARVKEHDEILRVNYGIGERESTGAKLDLANFSIDSKDSSKEDASDDTGSMENSNLKRINEVKDTNNCENDNPQNDDSHDSANERIQSSENLRKSRNRRFSRFSDLRKRNPMTYSQLRGKYGGQDEQTRIKESIPSFGDSDECRKINETTDKIVTDNLKTPDCRLVTSRRNKNEDGPSKEIKSCISRQRFSLSRYDSSNDSSSSNEALATFVESIESVARSREKIKYPGSPRAKFLQLLSERRRIVESTRSTGAS